MTTPIALTAAAPTRRHYRSAFEPGGSTGRLTARLADRCAHLLAVDAVESAVRTGDEVHAALAALPHLHRQARHVEADFVLEVFTRVPPDTHSADQRSVVRRSVAQRSVAQRSVAQRENLA